MILSRGRRYIFIHIPKTGGTALSLALEARATKDDILVGDTPKAQRRKARLKHIETEGRLWKHSTLADIRGLASDDEIRDFYIVTLVRNPWDRMVSYYHWLRAQSFAHPAVSLAQRLDFSAFLNTPETRASFAAHPYASYVKTADGCERCDLFIRLEQFDEDARPFEAHLGFRLAKLPLANRSERQRDWRPYYADADAQTIAEICAEDVCRFGYRFDSV